MSSPSMFFSLYVSGFGCLDFSPYPQEGSQHTLSISLCKPLKSLFCMRMETPYGHLHGVHNVCLLVWCLGSTTSHTCGPRAHQARDEASFPFSFFAIYAELLVLKTMLWNVYFQSNMHNKSTHICGICIKYQVVFKKLSNTPFSNIARQKLLCSNFMLEKCV